MDILEKEGPSVPEAVFSACRALGIDEKEAQVQVISAPGARRVKVRVGRPAPLAASSPWLGAGLARPWLPFWTGNGCRRLNMPRRIAKTAAVCLTNGGPPHSRQS